jgi:hypothetical protein
MTLGSLKAIEKGGNIKKLCPMLHEVDVDNLLAGKWTTLLWHISYSLKNEDCFSLANTGLDEKQEGRVALVEQPNPLFLLEVY